MFCEWGGAGLLAVTLWPLVARCNRNRNRDHCGASARWLRATGPSPLRCTAASPRRRTRGGTFNPSSGWQYSGAGLWTKALLYRAYVLPALTYYGPETWALTQEHMRRMLGGTLATGELIWGDMEVI
jgi:hypothetical protein